MRCFLGGERGGGDKPPKIGRAVGFRGFLGGWCPPDRPGAKFTAS